MSFFCENPLLHSAQLYGFSPVWTLMCLVKLLVCVNLLLHSAQLYGFSPVWTLMWIVNLFFLVNFLLHSVSAHTYDFSPFLWIIIWWSIEYKKKIQKSWGSKQKQTSNSDFWISRHVRPPKKKKKKKIGNRFKLAPLLFVWKKNIHDRFVWGGDLVVLFLWWWGEGKRGGGRGRQSKNKPPPHLFLFWFVNDKASHTNVQPTHIGCIQRLLSLYWTHIKILVPTLRFFFSFETKKDLNGFYDSAVQLVVLLKSLFLLMLFLKKSFWNKTEKSNPASSPSN